MAHFANEAHFVQKRADIQNGSVCM